MRIRLPEKVHTIITALQTRGYEAYAVGGCVRDSILGRVPSDWDITTSASPRQVKEIFPHTVDTGIAHGTVTVLLGREGFEVTTYRIDGVYEDRRHPKDVTFTRELREDLKRRDFTINAMAFNETAGLVDLFGGLEDLEQRRIRCVGDAAERFGEDALRIMRAVRFSAQLGFPIQEETALAAKELAPTLRQISAERVQTELTKLMLSPHPDWIYQAYELGITRVILPEFDAAMETELGDDRCLARTVGEQTLISLCHVPADRVLRLTMLLHDVGKAEETGEKDHAARSAELAGQVLRRLKYDRETTRRVTRLIRFHSVHPAPEGGAVRRMIYEVGEDLYPACLQVQRADLFALREEARTERLQALERVEALYQEIMARGDCLSLKRLALTGKDLAADGMTPGPDLGQVLGALLQEVLADPTRNERGWLLQRSRALRDAGAHSFYNENRDEKGS